MSVESQGDEAARDPGRLYLHELREEREPTAVERWLFGHGPELLQALGLPNGWWCGLFLNRADVFFDDADGDVDLIAGPLGLAITAAELNRWILDARGRVGPQFALAMAIQEIGEAGLVVWPPPVHRVVACEIKASWFDGSRWKATHAGQGSKRRIHGQLAYLRRVGVNKASLLQLGSTVMCEDWAAASAMLDRANAGMPALLDGPYAGFGSFRALMAPVPEWTEDVAGGHDGLLCFAEPTLINPFESRPWHERLRDRLAQMPKPRYFRTFIHPCSACGRWRHSGSGKAASFPCECQASVRSPSWCWVPKGKP